jgi:hypothetical protein
MCQRTHSGAQGWANGSGWPSPLLSRRACGWEGGAALSVTAHASLPGCRWSGPVPAGLALLVCVDGLASDVTAFLRGFRSPIRTGRPGRPRLGGEPGLLIGQVVKRYAQRRVVGVVHRVVRGTTEAIAAALAATGGGPVINTAARERLHAPFRSALAPLVRRGRALAQTEAVLTTGRYLVGCAYHFCWSHRRLRQRAREEAPQQWQERTPAMAAGWTEHCGTMQELLRDQVPLPAWVPPKRRGRPPKQRPQPRMAEAV